MFHETITLQVPYEAAGLSAEGCKAVLTAYVTEVMPEIGRHKRPAVLICPGGAYAYTSDREAEPIALAFLAAGIPAFVLRYSCGSKQFPTALMEAAEAMAYIRAHAEQFDLDPGKLLVCGFSAGGHLAASLSVHWDKPWLKQALGYTEEHKPNGSLLAYPVITTGSLAHQGSIENITSIDHSAEMLELVTLDRQVGPQTPPTFLWHCADDGCVPVENSLLYASALSKAKVPFALHIFPQGGHGLALANAITAKTACQLEPVAAQWITLAIEWVKRYFPEEQTEILGE